MLSSYSDARPIAMLIDGDNSQSSLLQHILAETTRYGIVTTRRIYGDWTTPQMSGWKESLNSLAVQPIQQFRYTTDTSSLRRPVALNDNAGDQQLTEAKKCTN